MAGVCGEEVLERRSHPPAALRRARASKGALNMPRGCHSGDWSVQGSGARVGLRAKAMGLAVAGGGIVQLLHSGKLRFFPVLVLRR